MKGKLIKTTKGYSLLDSTEDVIAKTQDKPNEVIKYQLSLKNCQTIANGYDLDELACNEIGIDISVIKHIDNKIKETDSPCTSLHEGGCVGSALYHRMKGFEIGFQKALEILGDKKFTEDDIRKTIFIVSNPLDTRYSSSEIISSLQQTEWDVEIEMEDVFIKNSDQYIDEGGVGNYSTHTKKPKLDADGCLILKR